MHLDGRLESYAQDAEGLSVMLTRVEVYISSSEFARLTVNLQEVSLYYTDMYNSRLNLDK